MGVRPFGTIACVLALILFGGVWTGTAVRLVHGADDLAGKKREAQRITREMREKKRLIERADQKQRSVLGEIERLDKAIQADGTELARQEMQLREVETALRLARKTNTETHQSLARLKQVYRDRVRALYKMGRSGYGATVLSSDSLPDAFKQIKYLAVIAEHDRQVILNYRSSLDSIGQREAEIARRTEDILRRKQGIETKRAELASQRLKKSAILASVKKERTRYEDMLRELEESSNNLWTMIRNAEREREASRKAAQRREAARRQAALRAPQPLPVVPRTAAPVRKGEFPWPISGEVITRFGVQQHPQFGTTVFRRGIEISARPGEEVRAVQDGTVAFADWYKGYGKLVILDHGAGLYSLYGHLSSHDLAKGAPVQRGQVIGLVGDTGSSRGAKLYFEIRSNGEAQDPLPWLAQR